MQRQSCPANSAEITSRCPGRKVLSRKRARCDSSGNSSAIGMGRILNAAGVGGQRGGGVGAGGQESGDRGRESGDGSFSIFAFAEWGRAGGEGAGEVDASRPVA